MVTFPNCKINLGLNILQKRADGFHDLETVFYPVDLKDALEVIAATNLTATNESTPSESILYSQSGIEINCSAADNLCIKAYNLLKTDFPLLSAVKLHLHKVIPMGAGLGGGSADAAFTLKLLNDKFHLNLTQDQLLQYAAQLGSDCPFFILNQPCLAQGRGELLEPVNLDLSSYQIMLVHPGIHINTGFAFSNITPAFPKKSISEIIQQPIFTWKDELINDFELPIFEKYPEIKAIKDVFYANGAVYASMSGSGSTVFGIFERQQVPEISFKSDYFTATVPLKCK